MGSWSVVSAPVIAGRVTMVIGIDDSTRPAPVGVFAFETMTGRLLWQSQIGGYANMNEGREVGTLREVDMLWSNSGGSDRRLRRICQRRPGDNVLPRPFRRQDEMVPYVQAHAHARR